MSHGLLSGMSPVYSHCRLHGTFTSRAIEVVDSTDVTIGPFWEPCPVCEQASQVFPGTFDFDKDGIATVLSGPDWTRKTYANAQRVLGRARQKLENGEDLKRVIADTARDLDQTNPGFGSWFAKQARSQEVSFTLALIALLIALTGVGFQAISTGLDIADAMRESVERSQQEKFSGAPSLDRATSSGVAPNSNSANDIKKRNDSDDDLELNGLVGDHQDVNTGETGNKIQD